jgi:hypothetical protein
MCSQAKMERLFALILAVIITEQAEAAFIAILVGT